MTAPAFTYSDLRNTIASLMLGRGEWAGCPVPIEGLTMTVERNYPYQGLNDCLAKPEEDAGPYDKHGLLPGEQLVNQWYSRQRECHVIVIRNAEGRAIHFTLPQKRYVRRLDLVMKSMQALDAHDLEAEMMAMTLLLDHVGDHKFRQYMLLGYFLETSKRSGVTYLFRRARPTVAMSPRSGHMKVIAVLCLHPIAYYNETLIGAMTPTDDVIAHLLLMRGDERMFWKRSYQHSPEEAEAVL